VFSVDFATLIQGAASMITRRGVGTVHALITLAVILPLVACGELPASEVSVTSEQDVDLTAHLPFASDIEPITGCEPTQEAWIIDQSVFPTPFFSRPNAREPFIDPTFHTCLVRVTDSGSDLTSDDPSGGLKNEYARVQSFNADGSLLIARSIEARWYLYDSRTLRILGEMPIAVEPRWDALDPHRLYYFDEARLLQLDLEAGEVQLVHDFVMDFPDQTLAAVWTRYEGSPSFDGRYWGLLAQDENWRATTLLVYDKEADQIVAHRELQGDPQIDSVTISPLGTYLLVYHDEICESDRDSDADHPCGLMVYDRDLEQGRSLLPVIGHSDTALDVQGREVLVFQDIQQDEISFVDLESGTISPLLTIDFSHSPIGFHFSGRADARPGWILISTYAGAQPSATWMDDSIFALELKPGGRVIRLAHTHSVVDEEQPHDYWAEPHASVNHDFTRVLFTSNWGRSGTEEVEMYMIFLPTTGVFDGSKQK
jgi:hypothetical protein